VMRIIGPEGEKKNGEWGKYETMNIIRMNT
jgi:hypothetical protein